GGEAVVVVPSVASDARPGRAVPAARSSHTPGTRAASIRPSAVARPPAFLPARLGDRAAPATGTRSVPLASDTPAPPRAAATSGTPAGPPAASSTDDAPAPRNSAA